MRATSRVCWLLRGAGRRRDAGAAAAGASGARPPLDQGRGLRAQFMARTRLLMYSWRLPACGDGKAGVRVVTNRGV